MTLSMLLLPPSILLYISLLAELARCSVTVDFSAYPAASRQCLNSEYQDSSCGGDTVADVNQCLCGNKGDFVLDTAACLASLGDQVLTEVYSIMETACSNTNTEISISANDFFSAANATASTVTSTITTTSAGHLTTYTTTSTSYDLSSVATSTSGAASTADDEDDSDDSDDDEDDDSITVSAKIGAITASVASLLMIACILCLLVLLKKRKRDKMLLQQAREAAARNAYPDRTSGGGGGGGINNDNDKPLLGPGATTPGFASPVGLGGQYQQNTIGASVMMPPTPTHPGPMSPRAWRSWAQQQQQQGASPGELSADPRVFELGAGGNGGHWPSPVSQGVGTMGSWCPSPVSAVPSSNAMGMYYYGAGGGAGGGAGTTSSTAGALSRQITGLTVTARSSWAHDRPRQEEPYELPGTEIRSPVEADSIPITIREEDEEDEEEERRLSMAISQAPPPEYSAGGWNDPITDKPPI